MDFHIIMTIKFSNFFQLKFHNTFIERLLLGLFGVMAYNLSIVPEIIFKLWKIYPVISLLRVNIYVIMNVQKINVKVF